MTVAAAASGPGRAGAHPAGHGPRTAGARARRAGPWPGAARKATTIAGMTVPGAFYAIIIVLGQVTPGYDPVSRFASELSLGRYGAVMITGFIATGLTELALGLTLRPVLGPQRPGRIASAMIALAGLAFLTAGAFLTDPAGQVRTVHGALHFAAAIVLFFIATPAGALAMGRHCRHHHRGFAAYSALTGAATPVLFIATVASGHLLGVMERIVIGVVLAWLTAVAIGLHRGRLAGAPA